MALFPHLDPSARPSRGRLLVPYHCIGGGSGSGFRSRRALLSVPLVLLIGFIVTAWFEVLGPIPAFVPAVHIPSFQAGKVVGGSSTTTTTTTTASTSKKEDLYKIHFAPVSSNPEANHTSPFSFDIAAILSAGNASSYANWMAGAPDDWSLARLAILGTHDTLTHRVDLVEFRCQNAALAEQLAAGVRYLDVRARVQVQPHPPPAGTDTGTQSHPLGIYHSHVYTGYEFADVAQTVFSFLELHPSEVVVMRLKEEGLPINGSVSDPPGPGPDDGQSAINFTSPTSSPFLDAFENYRAHDARTAAGFAKHLFRFNTTDDPSFWPSSPPPTRVPTMGQLRGKVLVLQEFPYFPVSYASGDGAAANVTIPWYGIPWDVSSSLLQVEDYWQTPDLAHLDDKWEAVRANLQAAAKNATAAANGEGGDEPAPLFLSHLSASVGVTPIDAAAGPANLSVEGINDRTGLWLERGDDQAAERSEGIGRRDGPYTPVGTVMADFPGRRLVDAILRRNSFFRFDE